jgi:hypothetical protein
MIYVLYHKARIFERAGPWRTELLGPFDSREEAERWAKRHLALTDDRNFKLTELDHLTETT